MELQGPKYKAYHETLTLLSHFTLQKSNNTHQTHIVGLGMDPGRLSESCGPLRSHVRDPQPTYSIATELRKRQEPALASESVLPP